MRIFPKILGSACAGDYLVLRDIKILRLKCFDFFFSDEIMNIKSKNANCNSLLKSFRRLTIKTEGNAPCVNLAKQGITK